MRDILFRGKKEIDGKWVVGSLVKMPGGSYQIIENTSGKAYRVKTDTVCQYTGMNDKNGKLIFEGDIIKHTKFGYILKVVYMNGAFYAEAYNDAMTEKYFPCDILTNEFTKNVEVTGNIFAPTKPKMTKADIIDFFKKQRSFIATLQDDDFIFGDFLTPFTGDLVDWYDEAIDVLSKE